MGLVQFAVRGFLETDAMTKSKFLEKDYIESKKVCKDEEINELIIEYDKRNTMGISFIIYKLLSNCLTKIIIYNIILLIIKNL